MIFTLKDLKCLTSLHVSPPRWSDKKSKSNKFSWFPRLFLRSMPGQSSCFLPGSPAPQERVCTESDLRLMTKDSCAAQESVLALVLPIPLGHPERQETASISRSLDSGLTPFCDRENSLSRNGLFSFLVFTGLFLTLCSRITPHLVVLRGPNCYAGIEVGLAT